MIDTHCHLTDDVLYQRLPAILRAAFDVGVRHFISVSASAQDWQRLSEIADNTIIPAFGIHPLFYDKNGRNQLKQCEYYLQKFPFSLVGECGLDFYDRPDFFQKNQQIECFEIQIHLAKKYRRPLIIHQRKAQNECIKIIKNQKFIDGGIAHAFCGSFEEAAQWIDHGFLLGIGTLLLRKNHRKLWHVLKKIPQDSWVLESDAPFMYPYNQPKIIAEIAHKITTIYRQPFEQIMAQNMSNILPKIGIQLQYAPL